MREVRKKKRRQTQVGLYLKHPQSAKDLRSFMVQYEIHVKTDAHNQ